MNRRRAPVLFALVAVLSFAPGCANLLESVYYRDVVNTPRDTSVVDGSTAMDATVHDASDDVAVGQDVTSVDGEVILDAIAIDDAITLDGGAADAIGVDGTAIDDAVELEASLIDQITLEATVHDSGSADARDASGFDVTDAGIFDTGTIRDVSGGSDTGLRDASDVTDSGLRDASDVTTDVSDGSHPDITPACAMPYQCPAASPDCSTIIPQRNAAFAVAQQTCCVSDADCVIASPTPCCSDEAAVALGPALDCFNSLPPQPACFGQCPDIACVVHTAACSNGLCIMTTGTTH